MGHKETPATRAGGLVYRPELDALRGIAVLLVIGGHLYVPGLAGGGNVGVALFFVLSGYLITSILRDNGSLGRFYLRRARRLLPALFLFLGVMVVVGVVTPAETAPTIGYVANVAWLRGQLAEPLGHTWTLATEEQFYLVWPLVLAVVTRPVPMLVGLIALCALLTVADPTGSATLAIGPFAAIAWGCLLSLGVVPRVPRVVVAGALAIIVWLVLAPPAGSLVNPAGLLLGVSIYVVMGVLVSRETGPLAVRPLMGVGRISYGLYLWHFPFTLTVWPRLFDGQDRPGDLALTLGVIAATFACATLSWLLLERWFLAPRQPARLVPVFGG